MTIGEIQASFNKQITVMNQQLMTGDYKGFVESAKMLAVSMEAKLNKLGEKEDVDEQT
jgi:hypothetical protein